MASKIERAINIAAGAHYGQEDEQGLPYILHPLRVGLAGLTEAEQIVGFLHDTLEDTVYKEKWLREDFGDDIANAVVLLTRTDTHTDMPQDAREVEYMEYVKRLAQNPLAKAVKINDLNDNLRRGDGSKKFNALRRRKRYLKALFYLTDRNCYDMPCDELVDRVVDGRTILHEEAMTKLTSPST